MAILGKVIKFGTKFGILGGACYYTAEAGLWADTAKAEDLYKNLYKNAVPYVKQRVVEVPELPKVSDFTRGLVKSWNNGVITSTDFLMHLPKHLANFVSSSYEKVNELVSDPKPPA